MSFKLFSVLSCDGHLVRWCGKILAILVAGYSRNISVKLFGNRVIGLTGNVV